MFEVYQSFLECYDAEFCVIEGVIAKSLFL